MDSLLRQQSCYCGSVAQPALCDPMDCSIRGFPILRHPPEFAQTHAHWVSDAIQPSHPLSSPSSLPSIFPSIRVFSNESALRSGGQSIGASASASVLPMNIQGIIFQGDCSSYEKKKNYLVITSLLWKLTYKVGFTYKCTLHTHPTTHTHTHTHRLPHNCST